jgi:ribosome-binding factor A
MSDRHDRVGALLCELAATFIQQEANTDPLITVTRADISPDYRRATIYFTTIPDNREADALAFLKRSGSNLRSFIKQKKANLKQIPFFDFAIDYGERHRQHIDEVAREIETRDKSKGT